MKTKTFLFTIAIVAMTGGLAGAAGGYGYHSCANNNSKACRDARSAFAEHHNGLSPEQYNNQWYQGQQGRWSQNGNNWRWNGAEGDQWYQGQQGHWYQERKGYQWRGDRDDQARSGNHSWQSSSERQRHDRARD